MRPTIISLFFSSRPSAVFWAVRAIIIDAVNAVFRAGLFPYIVKKCGKIVFPFVANVNSSSAIIFKMLIVWVEASAFHCHPRIIFRRATQPVRFISFCQLLFMNAPAAFSFPRRKQVAACGYLISAIANASPCGNDFVCVRPSFKNNKSAKALARDIIKGRHDTSSVDVECLDAAGVTAPAPSSIIPQGAAA